MRRNQELDVFLRGPLSDRHGGSPTAREAALTLASERSAIEDPNDAPEPGRTSFVLKSRKPLFSYQDEICASLSERRDGSSDRAVLVSLPTGAGKTRTGLWFYRLELERGHVQSLVWVAPSIELVGQAVDTIRDLWMSFPGAPPIEVAVGHIANSSQGNRARASFVTVQLAARRLDEIRRQKPEILVFDEAHQAVARTFRQIIREALGIEKCRVIGLTATPGRTEDSEGEDLSSLFGGNLITSSELGVDPVAYLISSGVLAKLEILMLPLPAQWERLRVRGKTARSLPIADLAVNPARFWSSARKTDELAKSGGRCLVFCASLAHSYALGGALRDLGTESAVLSYRTPPDRRRRLLEDFAEGHIRVLLNKTLLAEGYDCPAITDVVLTTPIRSSILWEQIVGRVGRGPAVGGTAIGRIWELDDHRAMHREVLSYARFLGDLWS